MSSSFVAAVEAWSAMLANSAQLHFLETHFDAVMVLAMALARPNPDGQAVDWDAVRREYSTEEEEQVLLSFVFVIQELVELIVRENLTFLIDNPTPATSTTSNSIDGSRTDVPSASQRGVAAHHEALIQKLPERFRLAFLDSLRKNWTLLQTNTAQDSVALNKLTHMSWRVVHPFVLMRIITSDNKRGILKVPMNQFHQLRYNTAKVLQEMAQMELHPIMRLTNLDQPKPTNATVAATEPRKRAAP